MAHRLNEDEIQLDLEKRNQIDHLRRQYNQNLRNDDGALWLSLDELDGVPAQDLARFVPAKEDGGNEHMRFVRFTRADVNAVMQYAKNPATLKKIYVANEKKLPQNVDLFKQLDPSNSRLERAPTRLCQPRGLSIGNPRGQVHRVDEYVSG